nr:hypothetical protein [Tanacetum cinerariifolium]
MVRKEASHQIILGVTNETHGIATGLIAGETDGMGLSTNGFRRFDGQKKPATKDDKSHLKCEECGMNRHTKDQCFKIIAKVCYGFAKRSGVLSSKPYKQPMDPHLKLQTDEGPFLLDSKHAALLNSSGRGSNHKKKDERNNDFISGVNSTGAKISAFESEMLARKLVLGDDDGKPLKPSHDDSKNGEPSSSHMELAYYANRLNDVSTTLKVNFHFMKYSAFIDADYDVGIRKL